MPVDGIRMPAAWIYFLIGVVASPSGKQWQTTERIYRLVNDKQPSEAGSDCNVI